MYQLIHIELADLLFEGTTAVLAQISLQKNQSDREGDKLSYSRSLAAKTHS